MAKQLVPITPKVLEWALGEAGLAVAEAADRLRVSEDTLRSWMKGESSPGIAEYRRLGVVLRRPLATFFLPSPPERSPGAAVHFRAPVGTSRRALNSVERDLLRDATRIQRAASWALREMEAPKVDLPRASTTSEPDAAAAKTRKLLTSCALAEFPVEGSVYDAQAWWREAIENTGVMVFFLACGEDACRGFSIWDDYAPVIVVNTWWRPEARVFSMLHEFGHLVTRSSSACLEQFGDTRKKPTDPEERWCEAFAARVIIPENEATGFLRTKHAWDGRANLNDVNVARSLGRHFKASTTAAALRMIGIGAAGWQLYRSIPRTSDAKRRGGGGRGEKRPQRRLREYGRRATQVLLRAVQADVLGRDDVLGYLRVGDHELDEMAA